MNSIKMQIMHHKNVTREDIFNFVWGWVFITVWNGVTPSDQMFRHVVEEFKEVNE